MTTSDKAQAVAERQTRVAPARWVVVAAYLAALTPLPSGLWRLLLVIGFPAGYTASGYDALDPTGWGAVYLVALSVGTEGAALLTLGLVRPWGEVVPRWVAVLGGRRVPTAAAIVPAVVGVVLCLVAWTPFLAWWQVAHPDLTPVGVTVIGILYLPLVAWAPLLAVVTYSYWTRRRG